MAIVIKTARQGDAETVADIGRRTFYETWKSVNTEEDLQQYMQKAFEIEKLKQEITNAETNTFLFIYVDNELGGYVKLRNDRTPAGLTDVRALELERIYVLKKFQDKKAGKALMDHVIEIAEKNNYSWIWLGVNQENYKAINFYKRYGFEVFGTKQFILGTAVDEDYLMKVELKRIPRIPHT